jgi:hypothetical protein
MPSFYAVATNSDKVKKHKDLADLNWLPMVTKINFVNMKQVHFDTKEKAVKLLELIKSKGMIVFKNWS